MTGPRVLRVALLIGLAVCSGTAQAELPRLFATWKAPYGQPRASDTLSLAAADSTGQDTLFLTYRTGKSSPFYVGVEGELLVRSQTGDTLSSFWHMDGVRRPNITVEFSTDSVPGCYRPFRGATFGGSVPDRTPGSGRLRLSSVVPITQPVTADADVLYFLCRVIFNRPTDPSVLRRPLCVEFAKAEFGLDSTVVTYAGREGQRFASWNSPKGTVCAPFREPESSKPKAQSSKPKAPGSR